MGISMVVVCPDCGAYVPCSEWATAVVAVPAHVPAGVVRAESPCLVLLCPGEGRVGFVLDAPLDDSD